MSVILGVHAPFSTNTHDPSSCLVHDGKLVFAIEEERLNRNKTSLGIFPEFSIRSALRYSGLSMSEIDYVALDGITAKGLTEKVTRQLQYTYGSCPEIKLVPHPLAHGSGAFFSSSFNKALVFSIDGEGDRISTLIYSQEKNVSKRSLYFKCNSDVSVGLFYTAFTNYLGFRSLEGEYKVMGMAAYGDSQRFSKQLSSLLYFNSETETIYQDQSIYDMSLHSSAYEAHCDFAKIFELVSVPPINETNSEFTQSHFDLAASVQYVFEALLLSLVSFYSEKSGINNLCLSGGVALNSLANMKLRNRGYNIFVQPAASDRGLSIGSSFYLASELGESIEPPRNMYLGNQYSDSEIERALTLSGLHYVKSNNIYKFAAGKINNGSIIGWFHGRSEYGPRALGARSIIASSAIKGNKDNLNAKIKYREKYRPFAPAILLEDFQNFTHETFDLPYMTETYVVPSQLKPYLSECCHNDGTARIQTVENDSNPLFHVLKELQYLNGVGCCINTSFNLSGEPIVESPTDALRTFVSCGLDLLCIGGFIVSKSSITTALI